MSTALVNYAVADGIATLELCNPKANAYSYEMNREIDEAVLRFRMDETAHAMVVTGAGDRFFCAGADIAMLQQATPAYKYYFCLHANETMSRFEQTPKLVIAALNGHTVGGGLEIAMACDLRIARKGAGKIGLPEVKLGVLPGTGGTQRLTRLVGKARAIEMMATGRLVEFEEALELGLVTGVVEADSRDEFVEAVREYTRQFIPPKAASRAVGFIKRAVQSGGEMSFADGLALERELQQQLFTGADAKEGLAANLERRDPIFGGS